MVQHRPIKHEQLPKTILTALHVVDTEPLPPQVVIAKEVQDEQQSPSVAVIPEVSQDISENSSSTGSSSCISVPHGSHAPQIVVERQSSPVQNSSLVDSSLMNNNTIVRPVSSSPSSSNLIGCTSTSMMSPPQQLPSTVRSLPPMSDKIVVPINHPQSSRLPATVPSSTSSTSTSSKPWDLSHVAAPNVAATNGNTALHSSYPRLHSNDSFASSGYYSRSSSLSSNESSQPVCSRTPTTMLRVCSTTVCHAALDLTRTTQTNSAAVTTVLAPHPYAAAPMRVGGGASFFFSTQDLYNNNSSSSTCTPMEAHERGSMFTVNTAPCSLYSCLSIDYDEDNHHHHHPNNNKNNLNIRQLKDIQRRQLDSVEQSIATNCKMTPPFDQKNGLSTDDAPFTLSASSTLHQSVSAQHHLPPSSIVTTSPSQTTNAIYTAAAAVPSLSMLNPERLDKLRQIIETNTATAAAISTNNNNNQLSSDSLVLHNWFGTSNNNDSTLNQAL